MDHSVVQRWLTGVLQPYPESKRIFAHVDRVLLAFSSLSPRTDVYTYDDGRTDLLLNLHGTIPIVFRTSDYNIPISIWLSKDYPREPPMAYVVPTAQMLVRSGRDVQLDGRITSSYTKGWREKWEAFNLLDFIRHLQDIFGQQPPVYAKPASVQSSAAAASASGSSSAAASGSASPRHSAATVDPRQRPPPAAPGGSATPGDTQGPPMRPPKPGASSTSAGGWEGTASPIPAQGGFGRSADAQGAGPPTQPPHSAQGLGFGQAPSRGWSAEQFQHPQHQHLQQQHQQYQRSASLGFSGPPPGHGYASPNRQASLSSGQAVGPPSVLPPAPGSRTAVGSGDGANGQGGPMANGAAAPPLPPHPDHLRSPISPTSYMGAGPSPSNLAPAPPPPPNPELLALHDALHARISSHLSSLHADLEAQKRQLTLLKADLEAGGPAIRDEMGRLEAVRDVCRATGDGFQKAVSEARGRIEELDGRGEIEVDELVLATSIVGNQLLQLQAEDSAISDVLYHLGRALNAERLPLDRFLKQTRFLAREQFLRRALADKIRKGMGWMSFEEVELVGLGSGSRAPHALRNASSHGRSGNGGSGGGGNAGAASASAGTGSGR